MSRTGLASFVVVWSGQLVSQMGTAMTRLHAYANPAHEQRMQAILSEEYPGVLVSLSSEALPQFREFERTMATALNAAVMPPVSRYVSVLRDALDAEGLRAPLLIMKSDGGVTSGATCIRCAYGLQRAGLGADGMGTGARSGGARAEGVHVAYALKTSEHRYATKVAIRIDWATRSRWSYMKSRLDGDAGPPDTSCRIVRTRLSRATTVPKNINGVPGMSKPVRTG